MNVTVVGLGRLGLAWALRADAVGHEVTGFDIDTGKVAAIGDRTFRSKEPGIDELLDDPACGLRVTTDLAEAMAGATVTVVTVPTPAAGDQPLSIHAVLDAVGNVGDVLGADGGGQVVVVSSTVPPGSIDGPVGERLRVRSPEAALVYCPEFHAIGSIVRDLTEPDLVVIGAREAWAGDVTEALWRSLASRAGAVAVHRMSPVSAELTKLALNSFLTLKISFANFAGELCARWGADPVAVCAALGDDPRIGAAFLAPGAPFGGPCFPRDNPALRAAARAVDLGAELPVAIMAVNAQRLDAIERTVLDSDARAIGLAGLAFKHGVDTVDGSPALELAQRWIASGRAVTFFDPLVEPFELRGATWAKTCEELVSHCDVVVLFDGDASTRRAINDACEVASARRRCPVVDVWRWGPA